MERQVSIRLSEQLMERLDRRARQRKRPRADVIRAALTAFLDLPDGALEGRPIDRVRDLVGAIGGLPRDLATNSRKHLAGLGRRR